MVENLDDTVEKMASGTDSATAVGGMASKLQAAKIVIRSGIPLVIASGAKQSVLATFWRAKRKAPCSCRNRPSCTGPQTLDRVFSIIPRVRCLWMKAPNRRCAKRARVCCRPGVAALRSTFEAGEVVRICDLDGTEFARGIADFDSNAVKTQHVASRCPGASRQPRDFVIYDLRFTIYASIDVRS